jgi:predicted CoA-binding protein
MSEIALAPPDPVLRAILAARPVIAVVGASSRPERPSHGVMRQMLDAGYEVHPVNPNEREVHGIRSWPDLASAPRVDLVDVFRRAEATPQIARDAVAAGARVLWLQLGVVNQEAGRIAREAGLIVVMDRCLWVEHERLIGAPHPPR